MPDEYNIIETDIQIVPSKKCVQDQSNFVGDRRHVGEIVVPAEAVFCFARKI
jgi:hypothetical protein